MPNLMASESVVEAGKRPITCTLNELLQEYDFDPGTLRGVRHILDVLKKYEISLDPEFEAEGSLDTARTLKAKRKSEDLIVEIQELLDTGGERYDVELKSSIRIDTKKKEFNPGLPISDCISEKLAIKLAQEICAFINRDGGTIIIGVQNDHFVCGCADDLDTFQTDGSKQDKADLLIKQIIDKNFTKPRSVLSLVQLEYTELESKPIVLLRIAKSGKLAFLKKDCGSSAQLYTRIGTNAEPISFEEIEDHFEITRREY
mgnify:CR=1 FL=1